MTSATETVCENLDLYGASFGPDEVDNRSMPERAEIDTAIACLFDPIVGLFDGCPLVEDTQATLWGLVNTLSAQLNRLDRALDNNERHQASLRERHDGSEVNDSALQAATDLGQALVNRRHAFEQMFDAAAREFEAATGSVWQPRYGSRPKSPHLTAAMIDSRDFTRARATKWNEDHLPAGPYVVVSGGQEFQDIDAIWACLDRVKAKHESFVLLHGGNKGVDTIASTWADSRGITQIRYGLHKRRADDRAAGFRRNEKMLGEMPIGVVTFPGKGVTKALIREARKLGIPVLDYDERQERCGRDASSDDTTVTSPETIISKLGADIVAKHFKIKEATVNAWLKKGIPAARIEAIQALNG